MNWKNMLLVIVGMIVFIVLANDVLVWKLVLSPKKDFYENLYAQKEKNIRGEIGTIKTDIQELKEGVADRPTYQVVYGLKTEEGVYEIPAFIRSSNMFYSIDSTGVISDVETGFEFKMPVPPHPDWRKWQEPNRSLKYVSRQLISADTTYKRMGSDQKMHFRITYRFKPVFEPVTEEQLLATMGNLGNKMLKDKIEAGEIETTEVDSGEKAIETKKEPVPVVVKTPALKKRPTVPKNF